MNASTEFLKEYQGNILYYPVMIPEMEDRYCLCACLKYMEQKQVYLIRGKSDNKKYIMKCVSKEGKESLREEYELHKTLTHEGIASAVEFIEGDKLNYLIREYIEGYTITEFVEMMKEGHLAEAEAARITIQLCNIVTYLHSQNPPIIHRDIKPDNVIYAKSGEVKLIDFGISRRFSAAHEKDTVIMGTESTAPPEQFGYKQTDARSDIYSIGVLLFYMITGSLNINEINESAISAGLKNIIVKCTEFSPKDRYSTMDQLELKLKKCMNRTDKSRGWIYAGFAVVLFLPVMLLLIFFSNKIGNNKMGNIDKSAVGIEQTAGDGNAGQDSKEILSSFELKENLPGTIDTEQSTMAQADAEKLASGQAGSDPTASDQMVPDQTAEVQNLDNGQDNLENPDSDKINIESELHGQTESNQGIREEGVTEQSPQNQTLQEQAGSDQAAAKLPYEFHSPLIEAAVRHELVLTDSDLITLQELDQIEELFVCGEQIYNSWSDHFVYGKSQYMNIPAYIEADIFRNQGSIESLEDISQMHNIRTLALYNQKISDLTPLKELKYLSRLGLGTNNISDISVLENIKSVQLLDVSGNPLDDYDMTVLNNLPELNDLDIGDTAVTSLQKLKTLKLKTLSLYGTKQGDCVGLNEMESLRTLIISGIGIGVSEAGMDKVVQLSDLTELRVMGSQRFDVSIFAAMKKLNHLDLCGCNVETFEGLKGLDLKTLGLDENKVKDLSPVKYFPNIEMLGIRNNPIEDYAPLVELPKLQFVNCNQEQMNTIKDRLKDTPYQFWIQQ